MKSTLLNNWILKIISGVLCVLLILRWLALFKFSPDSATYLTGAMNFVKHGELFLWANWPSTTMKPVIEPYAEFAPGFAIILIPFVAIFKNPMLAAAICQSIFIIVFAVAAYFLSNAIFKNKFFQIIFILSTALFSFYQYIFSYFWTEPLFIALTFIVAYCAIGIAKDEENTKLKKIAMVALFAGSAIKYIGILNFGLMLYPSLKGKNDWKKLLTRPNLENWKNYRQWTNKDHVHYATATFAPIILWFIRNKLKFGYTTSTHKAGRQFIADYLLVPWRHMALTFAGESYVILFLLWLVILIPLFLWLMQKRNKKQFVSEESTLLISKEDFEKYAILALGFASSFFGIWAISLVTVFNVLDARLLSTSYALFIACFLFSLCCILKLIKNSQVKIAVTTIFFLAIILHPGSSIKNLIKDQAINFKPLAEQALWEKLNNEPRARRATHFYTDYDFNHEIFTNKPQRIIWYDRLNENDIKVYLGLGKSPFFIFESKHPFTEQFKTYLKPLNLQREDYGDFIIYFAPQ